MPEVFTAYLNRLAELHRDLTQTLEGLPAEALNWSPGPEVNSLAALAAHTAGSERYWIGDVIGRDDSQRDRASEFRAHVFHAEEAITRLNTVLAHSRGIVESLTLADLEERRFVRDQREETVAWTLLHALEHIAIHLGHMQIMRQWWEAKSR
ncbi:hypothetical protein TFLX_01932 [Thermoflexales bacterium]|nr:hypothetical protein TFLX_01932 [Thermoflexales bacterium]